MRRRALLIAVLAGIMSLPASAAETKPVAAPEPRITVYANGSKDIGVFKGWPLILKVTVEHSLTGAAAKAQPITLQSDQDWTDLLRVDPLDAENRVHAWKFEKALLSKRAPSITLDDTHGAVLSFLVSPKESQRFEPGKYSVSVVLKGAVTAKSAPVVVEVLPHPASLPPKGEIARDRLLAMYHALKGDKEEAVRIVEKIHYVQTPGPVQYVQAPPEYAEPPPSNGGADLLGVISSLGFEGQIPSMDSMADFSDMGGSDDE